MKVKSKYQKTNANKVYWGVRKSPLMVRACHSFRFPLKQTPKQEFKYRWFIWEGIPGNTCGTVESKTRKETIKRYISSQLPSRATGITVWLGTLRQYRHHTVHI